MSTTPTLPTASKGLTHRAVWRWHFYAGLFCIPFILWLSVTGTIYLFRPQVEAFLDRPYDGLSITAPAPVSEQVRAALAAVPGSALDQYELPRNANASAQVLVDKGAQQFRVYVHPQTLAVLKVQNEDSRLERIVFHLHGDMLLGTAGSWIIELAGSWAVVMIVTGLFLWWPRNAAGIAGVLYPRLRAGGRIFWKDIHAVTGVYISVFALILLFTGLPWAKSWSSYLKTARQLTGQRAVKQDWMTDGTHTAHTAASSMAAQHSGHEGHDSGHHHATTLTDYSPLDRIAATVAPMALPFPVLLAPPATPGGAWTAKSDTQNRPQRVNLTLDPATGAVLTRTGFQSKPWLDRVIGRGIAAHEGQLFPLNQLLSLITVAGLVLLSVSGLVMWWRRRPEGVLGAPAPRGPVRFSAGLAVFVVAFGLYMPFLGATMILVFLTERFVLRRIPATRDWLGLQQA